MGKNYYFVSLDFLFFLLLISALEHNEYDKISFYFSFQYIYRFLLIISDDVVDKRANNRETNVSCMILNEISRADWYVFSLSWHKYKSTKQCKVYSIFFNPSFFWIQSKIWKQMADRKCL